MTERRWNASLRLKLLGMLAFGIILGVLTFFSVEYGGGVLVEKYYMSESASNARTREIAGQFQYYVTKNNLASTDTEAISHWTMDQRNVYILLYKDRHLALQAGWRDADEGLLDTEKELSGDIASYSVIFRDGVYEIVVYEFSETDQYNRITVLAIALGVFLLALVMVVYSGSITRRISRISRDVHQMEEGNLSLEIPSEGTDEIGRLAQGVDKMRASVLEHMESQQRAVGKNRELITAMSHDIRNPLTALMGYLDLARGQDVPEAERREYLDAAAERAGRLKELTDQLLRYSLLFGEQEPDMNVREYDAKLLFDQMVAEAGAQIAGSGLKVDLENRVESGTVAADVQNLQRVLENVHSNLMKYADPDFTVTGFTERCGEDVRICFENRIRTDGSPVESNRIGLRTCERLMELMGGSFRTQNDGETFTTELTLPGTKTQP